jgi:hypothetical protein
MPTRPHLIRMTMLEHNPEAQRAFARLRTDLEQRGLWEDHFAFFVEVVATECARYVRFGQEAQESGLIELETIVEGARASARSGLVEIGFLRADRQHLRLVTPEGLDADIVELVAP